MQSFSLRQLRLSLPVRLRIAQTEKKYFSFYVLGEPGVQINLFQHVKNVLDIPTVEQIDTYLNVGFGITYARKI